MARNVDPDFPVPLCCLPRDRPCGAAHLADVGEMVNEANPSGASPIRDAREITAAARLRYGIEAEWRKRAIGVVPAQPKARPEGQRQHSVSHNATLLKFGTKNIILRIGLDTCDLSPGQTS
ncbi:MAG: hypothetical protein ACK4HG_03055 [Agrobacterium albertimagni]